MKNEKAWNNEYKDSKLITKAVQPQKDFFRFLEWMKKNKNMNLDDNITVLDLGCGVGRNGFYMAENYNATVFGWDFSEHAIEKGKGLFKHKNLTLEKRDMTKSFPLGDNSMDLILDITASNALDEKGRATYLSEMHRVLKPTGYVYLRTLAKEGDKNARGLIKNFPGTEHDTYVHPDLHVTERVFSGPDFKSLYEPYFKVIRMLRKSGYQRFGKQNYKRNYWNIYMSAKNE
ncbi:MAG: class I SAM-dependent methyltransferase [Candidatus Pacebacteria bacterium]|nr:class I SAM-dependent methyltransferase [Candidatus Paceibacterota bacterium]